ncbi:diacylglycerol/lipid kinase family protein [Algibacter lectus]|uniref:YegS/Rv2252/BmrU family lipid kinase n=1 Tax=Algibacter lectus TaxID=221126 RepID=A0A4R8M5Y8_9FLAO|nr:diacylglycerol kinase family protein [Algibacter lectus]MWW26021.1 diacylglycerol kinase family lipid kinase [Algibacter lectus]TDY60749.1 YegS/Rv2252/BmrU family lipid kinase [Algibacter lectus]
MIDIHFIVNPIAGSGDHSFSEPFLQDYFEADRYNITIKSSGYKGHAIDLTKESINQQADIIVACGGDGTINEVASTLVGTTIPLGIVPIGSGNGLACHLNIPLNLKKALYIIKNNKRTAIDVGSVNKRYFFSNTGFAFTANVIENYEASQTRTLLCYIKACLKSFQDYSKKEKTVISIDDNIEIVNPFLIFISNSNVMGYKMSLTPKASLTDGLLDVVLVPRISRLRMLVFGFCMLIRKPELLKEVKCYQTSKLTLLRKKGTSFESQIDGEISKIDAKKLSISVERESLNILV